jgi:hypothetical protein
MRILAALFVIEPDDDFRLTKPVWWYPHAAARIRRD